MIETLPYPQSTAMFVACPHAECGLKYGGNNLTLVNNCYTIDIKYLLNIKSKEETTKMYLIIIYKSTTMLLFKSCNIINIV